MTPLRPARAIGPSLAGMVDGSANVLLTRPRVLVFELHRATGGLANALLYVASAAAFAGLVGLMTGLEGAVRTGSRVIASFLLLAGAFHLVGWLSGSRGSLGGVAYCVALFFVPFWLLTVSLSLLLAVRVMGIVLVPLLMIAVPAALL